MARLFHARIVATAIAIFLSACVSNATAAAADNVVARAKQERPALLDTLKELVAIESGRRLAVRERSAGGGTDAAYAQLKTKAAVVEGFGLQGYGPHTTDAEYILIPSVEPRLYLAARMIMDIAQGKAQ